MLRLSSQWRLLPVSSLCCSRWLSVNSGLLFASADVDKFGALSSEQPREEQSLAVTGLYMQFDLWPLQPRHYQQSLFLFCQDFSSILTKRAGSCLLEPDFILKVADRMWNPSYTTTNQKTLKINHLCYFRSKLWSAFLPKIHSFLTKKLKLQCLFSKYCTNLLFFFFPEFGCFFSRSNTANANFA